MTSVKIGCPEFDEILYLALQNKRKLTTSSKLLSLCPKLDEDGVMRLNTRLQYAEFYLMM